MSILSSIESCISLLISALDAGSRFMDSGSSLLNGKGVGGVGGLSKDFYVEVKGLKDDFERSIRDGFEDLLFKEDLNRLRDFVARLERIEFYQNSGRLSDANGLFDEIYLDCKYASNRVGSGADSWVAPWVIGELSLIYFSLISSVDFKASIEVLDRYKNFRIELVEKFGLKMISSGEVSWVGVANFISGDDFSFIESLIGCGGSPGGDVVSIVPRDVSIDVCVSVLTPCFPPASVYRGPCRILRWHVDAGERVSKDKCVADLEFIDSGIIFEVIAGISGIFYKRVKDAGVSFNSERSLIGLIKYEGDF